MKIYKIMQTDCSVSKSLDIQTGKCYGCHLSREDNQESRNQKQRKAYGPT